MDQKTGVELIREERIRQIHEEGWTLEHDAQHTDRSLAFAAACYAVHSHGIGFDGLPIIWPWDREWWKPSDDPIRNLAKAGALIAAEIDRLQAMKQ